MSIVSSALERSFRTTAQAALRPGADQALEAAGEKADRALPLGDRLSRGPAEAIAHADGQLTASDGQAIRYRTTTPAGPTRAVFVMQMGTLGQPAYFDQLGEQLAQAGIKSYAVGSRVEAGAFTQYADDFDRVMQQARAENPGARISAGGVSLGASIVLDWSARHNASRLPVVAMSPVVLNRFLGPKDTAAVVGSLVSDRAARIPVATPMSAGVPLTTNLASPEAQLTDPQAMKVPAGLFGDVFKMNAQVALKGRQMTGPLLMLTAGNDQVAINPAARAFSHLIGSSNKRIVNVPGAAHDLSQEANHPVLVDSLRSFVLPPDASLGSAARR